MALRAFSRSSFSTLILGLALGLGPVAQGQERVSRRDAFQDGAATTFQNGLLEGRYAMFSRGMRGHTPGTAIFIVDFDGHSRFSMFGEANAPGPDFGKRAIVPLSDAGSYLVRADGTGTMDTNTGRQFLIAILETGMDQGAPVATELCVSAMELDRTSGALVSGVITRLPEGREFEDASLDGSYALVAGEGEASLPASGVVTLQFGGAGSFDGMTHLNLPGDAPCERQMLEIPVTGTYDLGPDGLGSAMLSQLGEASILVTRAISGTPDNAPCVTEFVLVVRDLTSTHGAFIVLHGKRNGN